MLLIPEWPRAKKETTETVGGLKMYVDMSMTKDLSEVVRVEEIRVCVEDHRFTLCLDDFKNADGESIFDALMTEFPDKMVELFMKEVEER